jgi:hypothetical protein
VAKVALEAGNSPQMIFQHYRELVRPKGAKEWFAIMPKREAIKPDVPKEEDYERQAAVCAKDQGSAGPAN